MAVKLRLIRMGKKRTAYYRVVVMDGRAPRDGRYIEQIGVYDPNQQPSKVEIDNEKAIDWMKKGAQPTGPVRKLLEISGAMSRFQVASGKIHTVAPKAAAPAAVAEAPPAEVPVEDAPVAESAVEAEEAPVEDAPAADAAETAVDADGEEE